MAKTNDECYPSGVLPGVGGAILRFGLAAVLIWIGALKFTDYEAEGIKPLVTNSPLMSGALKAIGLKDLARALGMIEIAMGVMIAARPISAKTSALGSLGAIVMFLITLSFLVTTPGVCQKDHEFPCLSPETGQFLAKDILLLGAAVWTAGEALQAARED